MKGFFYRFLARLRGRNSQSMPKDVILDQMNEPRPLPMGRFDFEVWSERIISGALIPNAEGKTLQETTKTATNLWGSEHHIFYKSQQYALANLLMHLGPTESHKPDAFFIHSLRKFAVNQVADTIRRELHDEAKARTAEEEAKKEAS